MIRPKASHRFIYPLGNANDASYIAPKVTYYATGRPMADDA
ncbi:hypothetical protein ACK9YZ_34685 (plasmid) [Rhizobium sp. ZK1]